VDGESCGVETPLKVVSGTSEAAGAGDLYMLEEEVGGGFGYVHVSAIEAVP
jgi:hypothetical protein